MLGLRLRLANRVMRQLLFLLALLLLSSCLSDSPTKGQEPSDNESVESLSPTPLEPKNQGTANPAPSTNAHQPTPVMDRYEEGLIDGEAAAEEDRLAGKPGMQVGDGDEDDADDYDDGYDDGYDE